MFTYSRKSLARNRSSLATWCTQRRGWRSGCWPPATCRSATPASRSSIWTVNQPSPILMFQYSKFLSGKSKMGLLINFFNQWSTEKNTLKNAFFQFSKIFFPRYCFPLTFNQIFFLTNPSQIFLKNILSTEASKLDLAG